MVAPFWSVPHAQVYAQCDRLLRGRLLSEVRQEGGRNRRLMRLTDEGKAALAEWLAGRAGDVTWSSGAALPLVVLLVGLLSTGAIGHWLWTRRPLPA